MHSTRYNYTLSQTYFHLRLMFGLNSFVSNWLYLTRFSNHYIKLLCINYTSLSLLFNFFYTDLCITDCGLVSLLARFSNHYKQAFVRKLSTLLSLFPNSFIQTLRHKLVYASFFGLIPFASCKGIQSC